VASPAQTAGWNITPTLNNLNGLRNIPFSKKPMLCRSAQQVHCRALLPPPASPWRPGTEDCAPCHTNETTSVAVRLPVGGSDPSDPAVTLHQVTQLRPRTPRHACAPEAQAALKAARAPYQTLSHRRRPLACFGRALRACLSEHPDARDTLVQPRVRPPANYRSSPAASGSPAASCAPLP